MNISFTFHFFVYKYTKKLNFEPFVNYIYTYMKLIAN